MSSQTAKRDVFVQLARIGTALSSPVRLELLELMAQGERSVDDLATLTKTGVSTVTLSGNNSNFSGTRQVNEGILSFTTANSLGTGAINIASGAKVNLGYSKTANPIPKVNGLTLGGVVQLPGTYGSTTSNATNKNNTWFSGNGQIQVLAASATTIALTSGTSPAVPGASS